MTMTKRRNGGTARRCGRRVGMLAVLMSGALGASARAQSPCEAPASVVVVNPSQVAMRSPDHATTILGGAEYLVTAYELQYYAEGAPSAFQTVTMPRDAWVLATGTTDCYTGTPTSWPLTPNTRYRAVLVARANPAAAVADSPPSEESNPFGRVTPPAAPALTRIR